MINDYSWPTNQRKKEDTSMEINTEQAKGWLDKATADAQEVINNPSKVDDILIQLEEKLKTVPAIGER